MVQLSFAQRVFVGRTYFESSSYVEVKRLISLRFPEREPPDNMTNKNIPIIGTSLNME